MTILLIGYGDIAQRTARRLVSEGHAVVGLCRHPEEKPALEGVKLMAGDAGNEQDLKSVLLSTEFAAIVVTLTPADSDDGRYSAEGYRKGYVVPCRHLQQVINGLDYSPYVVYVSSTGVYGQQDGEWVDENSPTQPSSDVGKMLLQAESLIRDLPVPSTIVRCSGIYGQGRDYLLRQIREGGVTLRESWTNRIHQDDVARFIAFLITHSDKREDLYLLSDDAPVMQYEVYQWLAKQLGVEISAEVEPGPGPRGSKRCNNQRVRDSGFTLEYPTYRDGYEEMF